MKAAALLCLLAAAPDVGAMLPPGPRYGLLVVDEAGRTVASIDPDGRYMPASTVKLATTATAWATLRVDDPDTGGGASLRIDGGDVILSGHGDARLSGEAGCAVDCLATLADAVAARVRTIRHVVGDDTAFPDERWPAGMSWNNMATRSGTAISALTLDDNVVELTVTAARRVGGDGYYRIDDRVRRAPGPTRIAADRAPGSDVVRVTGTIAADAPPTRLRVAIEDPAHRAAWRLAAMLRERGVRVTGGPVARHRPADEADDPAFRGATPPPRPPEPAPLARLVPPPLAADIALTNKSSQNLHAELLLRRVGAVAGTGSVADGVAAIGRTMAAAGIRRDSWDLADGSGMSSYDRISPRAMVALLRWTGRQPWGAAWAATLPVGGVDGTLARRFAGTPLAGRIVAKTGTLNGTAALAGWITAVSGQRLTFAFYANDVPATVAAATAMDRALVAIAGVN